MIRTIEYSLGDSIIFNSPLEQFYFNMTHAWMQHGVTPNEFRNIYSSDYYIIKQIETVIEDKIKTKNKLNRVGHEMELEMTRRRLT